MSLVDSTSNVFLATLRVGDLHSVTVENPIQSDARPTEARMLNLSQIVFGGQTYLRRRANQEIPTHSTEQLKCQPDRFIPLSQVRRALLIPRGLKLETCHCLPKYLLERLRPVMSFHRVFTTVGCICAEHCGIPTTRLHNLLSFREVPGKDPPCRLHNDRRHGNERAICLHCRAPYQRWPSP